MSALILKVTPPLLIAWLSLLMLLLVLVFVFNINPYSKIGASLYLGMLLPPLAGLFIACLGMLGVSI